MSNITHEGRSYSSGVGEEVQQQELLLQDHHLNSIANSSTTATTTTTANSNGSASTTQQLQPPPAKKKRNLPGNPDPSAEVVALSPHTLLATNRFVCEICNKGFQRDQNLQLHRRGHNLPWKLKQRTNTEIIKKKVYVCPESSCVHHNPARALGDLTGIKKHFSRKHGEKKWKCDKCSKKYAVKSDWKAHSKTCGTKEYKCDCGTIFSRRDSFITHRAFCDALTEENNKANQGLVPNNMEQNLQGQVPNPISMPINNNNNNNNQDQSTTLIANFNHHVDTKIPLPHELIPVPAKLSSGTMFSSSATSLLGGGRTAMSNSSSSSCLQLNADSSTIFQGNGQLASAASMSATALLQKAAQMGATTTGSNNLNSPMTHKSFVFTSMAPSTYASIQTQNEETGGNDGYVNQFFHANEMGMFNGVLDHQDTAIFKNIHEQESSNNKSFFHGAISSSGASNQSAGGLSRFTGDVMTVDFLGVGGPRKRNIHEVQQKQEMEFIGINGHHPRMQGLGHFEQQAALEKPMWDV